MRDPRDGSDPGIASLQQMPVRSSLQQQHEELMNKRRSSGGGSMSPQPGPSCNSRGITLASKPVAFKAWHPAVSVLFAVSPGVFNLSPL
jgi:hypothetical protein